jgi:hypothetical protein
MEKENKEMMQVPENEGYVVMSDLPKDENWLCVKYEDLLQKENGKYRDGGEKYRDALEELDNDEKLDELTKCAEDFRYFAENYVWITHPKRGLILFDLYGYQMKCIREYDQFKHSIIRKFRQGGLTTLTVIWCLWRCIFRTDQKIMVLSKSDREAKSAGKIVTNVMKYLPAWMKPDVELDNQHEKVFADTNGSIEFWTCEAARSKSLTYLIIDEAAFIKNMDEHWKSMYPTLSTGGSCIVISTVNGLGNWYEEWYHAAELGRNMFHVIDIDYRENPEYCNEKWATEMRANLGEKGWRQEVLGDFLGSGETYVNGDTLSALAKSTGRTAPIKKLFPEWENDDTGAHEDWKMLNPKYNRGALWIWEEPKDGVEYIIGADVAAGIGGVGDNSAFHVVRLDTMEQVAEFYSNSIPANDFAQVIHNVGHWYKEALVVVEAAEQGLTVINKLEHWLGYGNLYYETRRNTETAGVAMTRVNRPVYLEQMQSFLQNRHIAIQSSRLVRELKTFVVINRKPQAQKGKHDDLVMSLALLLGVLDSRKRDVPVGGTQYADKAIDLSRGDLFLKIKAELEGGLIEQLLAQQRDEDQDEMMNRDEAAMMGRVMHDIKRPYDELLREFDW